MYLQSIKSVKQNAGKSVIQVNLKKSRHIGFGVFIVHKSVVSGMRVKSSVADPDPGLGAFSTPGSGMGESQHPDPGSGMNIPDHIF
jgi:hypothetical protein